MNKYEIKKFIWFVYQINESMNHKSQDIASEIRRNVRLDSNTENESELVKLSTELLVSLQPDIEQPLFLQTIDSLIDNINSMEIDEINSFSANISYTVVFAMIQNSDNLNVQIKLFTFLCIMIKGKQFDPYEFIKPEPLIFLLLVLNNKSLAPYSFHILSELCNECDKLPLILLDHGILNHILSDEIDEIKSQLLFIFIRDIKNPELEIQFIPYIQMMIQSDIVEVVYNGIQSFLSLNLYSKDPLAPEDFKAEIQQLSSFFLSNFQHIFELNEEKTISQYLIILSTIDNLPVELAQPIMDLFSNESPKIVRSVADIFITQVVNWKESVDTNTLFQKLTPLFESAFSIHLEYLIYKTLLLYGNSQFYIYPIMLANIIRFLHTDFARVDSLSAIYQILTNEKNTEGIFNVYFDEIIEAATEEVDNGTSQDSVSLANALLVCINS